MTEPVAQEPENTYSWTIFTGHALPTPLPSKPQGRISTYLQAAHCTPGPQAWTKEHPSHQRQNRCPEATRAPPGCPSQGRGLPALTLCSSMSDAPSRPPSTQQTRTTCGARSSAASLNHPVCLRSRQMILETTCATLLPFIIYAVKWGSSLDRKHPCVSASWSSQRVTQRQYLTVEILMGSAGEVKVL